MNRELRKFIFDFYLGCIQICLLQIILQRTSQLNCLWSETSCDTSFSQRARYRSGNIYSDQPLLFKKKLYEKVNVWILKPNLSYMQCDLSQSMLSWVHRKPLVPLFFFFPVQFLVC